MSTWYLFAASEAAAEISIFDSIGGYDGAQSLKDFKERFDRVKAKSTIKLLLNCRGGDVFDGMAIFNLLSSVRSRLSVEILGVAASVASVIALAGKDLTMAAGAFFMLHNPAAFLYGDAAALRKTAANLDLIGASMAEIYSSRLQLALVEVRDLMAQETWFTAEEVILKGWAKARRGSAATASAKMRQPLAAAGWLGLPYRNIPTALRRAGELPPAPDPAESWTEKDASVAAQLGLSKAAYLKSNRR